MDASQFRRIDDVCDGFEAAWKAGERPLLEGHLARAAPGDQAALFAELLRLELEYRARAGETPRLDEYRVRFPDRQLQTQDLPDTTPAYPEGAGTPFVSGYEILGELGRGGMGVVFKARHLALGRVVALKMIRSGEWAGPEERERFRAEAEAVARLSHPNIVQIYEVGECDGEPFFSLELCAGGNLARRLKDSPLTAADAASLVRALAEAAAHAHARDIVHRDIKPANVLRSADGAWKLTDFGLAKRLDAATNTQTGAFLGTPAYAAPEQARGQNREVGPAADVYALGAVLYECLVGRPPFNDPDPVETLLQVVGAEPVPPRALQPKIPRDLETITLKCLEKTPARRYESARALADDLGRFLAGEPILARPAGRAERAAKWAKRRPTAAAFLASGVLAGLLVGGLAVFASVQWQAAAAALKQRDESERDRALAQIDALRDAAPGAVPGILDNLAGNRDGVLSDLRERYAQEPDPARKARLALALLPVEPETVRDELVGVMLTADDPAEAVLIRDTLKPHAGGLSGGLWDKAGAADAEARFRALVALAAFDPDDARWKEAAPKLAGDLLGKNPLHLGAWVRALEPVSNALAEPLGTFFRDGRPERAAQREAAAQALKLYLTRRPDPETLCGLLLDADARQHALLRPLLDADRERAAARMSAELAKRPDYWKDRPLDVAWKTPDAAIVGEIEKGGGIVAERFALCQALPLGRLSAVTEGMRASGYRPLSVRPWGEGRVALVWARDGRDWRLERGLMLAGLKERDAHWQKAGLIPADVAAYATQDGERYVGLWRRGIEGEEAVLYAGVPAEKHVSGTDGFKNDGFAPARVQRLFHDGATSYCGIWGKGKDKIEGWDVRWDDDEGLHKGLVADGAGLLLDVSVAPAEEAKPLRRRWLADLKRATADVKKQPEGGQPRFSRGMALFELGRDEEAIKDFDFLVQKYPKVAAAYRYRAVLHARAGNAEQARKDLASFAKLGTDKPRMTPLTALVAVYLGAADEALKELDETVQANGKDAALAYQAACTYSRASEHARTRQAAWAMSLLGSPSPLTLALRPAPKQQPGYADRSLELLRLAVARGYGDFAALQADADLEAVRSRAGYRELLRQNGLLRRYASVWRDDATRQAEALQGLTSEAHLKRCRELAAKGYRPVALSLASLSDENEPFAASAWHRPVVLPDREALARRRAAAAVTLLTLKRTEEVWPLFRHSADPTSRSYLVWRAGEFGADPRLLIERLPKEQDVSARRALIVALGEYDDKRLPRKDRQPLVKTLLSWYRDDPDPGIHAAIGWLLRHKAEGPTPRLLDWGQADALAKIDEELAGKRPRTKSALPPPPRRGEGGRGGEGWYVNGQGQTMVMIGGPVEFRMGSPLWQPNRLGAYERPHMRRIERSYAIASTSVTIAQWRRFLKERPEVRPNYQNSLSEKEGLKHYSPEPGGPVVNVTYYEAMAYCNWLSEKEDLPKEQWCYPDKITQGMKPFPDYLRRTGYRLPSEAEWECACKAGTQESGYYGSSSDLLPRYAHFQDNCKGRTWPVGQKRPNDLGLLDVHGNVWTWCGEMVLLDPERPSALSATDSEDAQIIDESSDRPLRGGSFLNGAPAVRSSNRDSSRPANRNYNAGLRVCRTLPPDSFPILPPAR